MYVTREIKRKLTTCVLNKKGNGEREWHCLRENSLVKK